MRTIKFRGRNNAIGWVYGDLHLLSSHPHIHTSQAERYSIFPHTVGQFTGFKDMDGKEIYEGDILTINHYGLGKRDVVVAWSENTGSYWCETNTLATVLFEQGDWMFRTFKEQGFAKVIGNIHDNNI